MGRIRAGGRGGGERGGLGRMERSGSEAALKIEEDTGRLLSVMAAVGCDACG